MNIINYITSLVDALGYTGIFIMTVIEGTLIPIPNEVTMIPAGYLIATGKMSMLGVIIAGVLGNLIGGWITYYIAYHYGNKLVHKFGKYVFFSVEKLAKVEKYFAEHGPISIALGRIMPGLKHFISFPAGLAKMNFLLFSIYTIIGGGTWIIILVLLGYFIGNNDELTSQYLEQMQWYILFGIIFIITLYIMYNKKKKKHLK